MTNTGERGARRQSLASAIAAVRPSNRAEQQEKGSLGRIGSPP